MDESRNKELLEEVIEQKLSNMKNLKEGSEDHTRAVNDLAKLYQLKIDEDKAMLSAKEKEAELRLKETQRLDDITHNAAQLRNDKKNRIVKLIIDGAGILISGASIVVGANLWHEGLKFETEGTVGSSMFRNLISRCTSLIFRK